MNGSVATVAEPVANALSQMRFSGVALYRSAGCAGQSGGAVVVTRNESCPLSVAAGTSSGISANASCTASVAASASSKWFQRSVDCAQGLASLEAALFEANASLVQIETFTGSDKCGSSSRDHTRFALVAAGVCLPYVDSSRNPSVTPSATATSSPQAAVYHANFSLPATFSFAENTTSDLINNSITLFEAQYADPSCTTASLIATVPLGVNGKCAIFPNTEVSGTATLLHPHGVSITRTYPSSAHCAAQDPVALRYTLSYTPCMPSPADYCYPLGPGAVVHTTCQPGFSLNAYRAFLAANASAAALPSQNTSYVHMLSFWDDACSALRALEAVLVDTCLDATVGAAVLFAGEGWGVDGDAAVGTVTTSGDGRKYYRVARPLEGTPVQVQFFSDSLCKTGTGNMNPGLANAGCQSRIMLFYGRDSMSPPTAKPAAAATSSLFASPTLSTIPQLDPSHGGQVVQQDPSNGTPQNLGSNDGGNQVALATGVFFGMIGLCGMMALVYFGVAFGRRWWKARKERLIYARTGSKEGLGTVELEGDQEFLMAPLDGASMHTVQQRDTENANEP
ncbi:hypothetical protein BC830DRAFT_1132911 [Chytriomyces sp. MP71]|nr:hypothetical protein BC830DRAFT_1132911 [Chytriomyces sp. MP71]